MMRARSPIEMMVDKACGFDPNAPEPPRAKIEVADSNTQAVLNVCEAAAAWVMAIDSGSEREVRDAERVLKQTARELVATGW